MNQRGIVWLTLLPYIIGAVVFIGAATAAYQYVDNNWATDAGIEKGRAEVQAKWDQAALEQRQAEEKRIEEASTKKEQGDAKAKVVYRTITQTVDRYIDRPVYRNQCLDDDGLRDANRALLGTITPSSGSDKPMPTADGAAGQDRGGGSAEADRGK